MRTKLLALLAGIAMTSATGMAQAADTASAARTETLPARKPIVLANAQMDKVTAGHWFTSQGVGLGVHVGWYRTETCFIACLKIPQYGEHLDPTY
jgi:hypothetical protein